MPSFPKTRTFTGDFAPIRIEADVEDLETEGKLPLGLDGAFYRVQPDPHFPPLLGDDQVFNGDGMISMFRFKNGRVDLKRNDGTRNEIKNPSRLISVPYTTEPLPGRFPAPYRTFLPRQTAAAIHRHRR